MVRAVRRIFLWSLVGVLLFGAASNLWIWSAAIGRMEGKVPEGAIIVVLGTSEFLEDGKTPTSTYPPRMTRAAEIAKSGRASLLIVSGTEVQAESMARELSSGGCPVPIELDPYGLRTLDTVMRAKAHHPGSQLVFVSQGWHCARALWWADRLGVPAVAAPCAYGEGIEAHRAAARELLAKPKAVIDWLLGPAVISSSPPDRGNRPAR